MKRHYYKYLGHTKENKLADNKSTWSDFSPINWKTVNLKKAGLSEWLQHKSFVGKAIEL